jgi:asparagine synthase (glutamine-hydrolysing)
MCGIAGALSFGAGEPVSVETIRRMNDAQAHRGPDGEGAAFFLVDGRVVPLAEAGLEPSGIVAALAHRRLAIIDLSERGAQPMACGECWITFNGEIYNYRELRVELEARGLAFRSDSDTEVILHAYRVWGPDCVERLNGMFAFAIWDTRTRRLFCVRDRLGIKPFYYAMNGGRFLFASEPKSLLAAIGGRPQVNVEALEDYLTLSYVLTKETMFKGVHRLPPATWLTVDEHGLRECRYWDPDFDPRPRPVSESVDELRALLDDSLRLQVRSDVPIGAHLSGGIDSSTVCCFAAKYVPKLACFTARFDGGDFFDETKYARLVAQHLGAEYHQVTPRPTELSETLHRILYHLDEPVEAASVFGKYHVAQIVSESVKVVLGGQGGDELFGGYDWYVKSLFTAALGGRRTVVGDVDAGAFMLGTLRNENLKRLAKSLWKNRRDLRLSRVFYGNWSRLTPSEARRILARSVVNGQPTTQDRFLDEFGRLRERRDGDRMFKFDMRHYLEALLTSEDRLSMAFSVESRVPLLDHRIVELAGGLGFEQKATPGRAKDLLRRAASGVVPAAILARRDKRGFPTPIGGWLRDKRLRLIESLVLDGNDFARSYLDVRRIRELSEKPSSFGTDWSERMWRILTASVWGQVFGVR